jgi:hypothetical protein
MSSEVTNVLVVLAYIFVGTFGLALLITWITKRFGPPK